MLKRILLGLLLTLSLIAIAPSLTIDVQAQGVVKPCAANRFFTVETAGVVHYAVAAGCNEVSTNCEAKYYETKNNCEYRDEGGWDLYSSCTCQGLREWKTCMRDGGCYWTQEYVRIQNEYWFCFAQ